MFRHYLLVAWRNLIRDRGYTLLNLVGLSMGITISLIVGLYLRQQLAYDHHHTQSSRIFRISIDVQGPDDGYRWSTSQFPLGPMIEAQIPEVAHALRLVDNARTQFTHGEISLFDENVYLADESLPAVLSFDWLAGDPAQALSAPNSVVLSQSLATKLFGRHEVVGEIVRIDGKQDVKVTAVFADWPETSHLVAHAFLSTADLPARFSNWAVFNTWTYVLLKPDADRAAFEAKLDDLRAEKVAPIFAQRGQTQSYHLLPLTDIHLYSDFAHEPEPVGSAQRLSLFGVVGLLVLLMACINYMNLATARSARRAREVGLRKVMGSHRSSLVTQFLAESLILTLLAFLLSMGWIALGLPFFNHMLPVPLTLAGLFSGTSWMVVLGLVLLTGLIAGSYPAWFLSAFQPIQVLQGGTLRLPSNRLLRQVLVVVQLSLSLFMLISTMTIYQQMQYLRDYELGFTEAPVLQCVLANAKDRARWPELRQRLRQVPGVVDAATTMNPPGEEYGTMQFPVEQPNGEMRPTQVNLMLIDFDYRSTLDIPIVAGRDVDPKLATDSALAVLVNERMVSALGWEEAIGKVITLPGRTPRPAKVVGVLADFHQKGLHQPVEPLLFVIRPQNSKVLLRMEAQALAQALPAVTRVWREVFPDQPFEYSFLDQAYQRQYEADQLMGRLFLVLAVLTLLIACLGLLGLASFAASQRSREIGIRKIVGANLWQLIGLLTKEFVWLTLIATGVGSIIAWQFLDQWLADFAYHVSPSLWLFGGAMLLLLLLTVATTLYHAWRAGTRNPVDTLRYE
jgi:putative ABC transport system permease protein